MILGIFLLLVFGLGIYSYKTSAFKKKSSVPENTPKILEENVLFYKKLSDHEKKRFLKKVKEFLNETYIDSVGFKLEPLDVVLVAASAVIPVFYFKDWKYSNLSTVILYPDYFNKDLKFKGENRNIGGLVGSGRYHHQMILSRKALRFGFNNTSDKSNTGIHEFVHLIDKIDGDVDGIPKALFSNSYTIPWLNLIHNEIEAINSNKSDIRAYGGINQQEFFAVAAEYFFERPELFKRKHPELYRMMELCFCKRM